MPGTLSQAASPQRRALLNGVLFWLAVGALGILLRGVRWDEGFERAQAMLGMVPYPEGHPLRIYAWNAFSIHYYSSALLLKLSGSPLLICGLRDLICVWGALAPVFMLASLTAGCTRAGHVAALFILANAHAVFRSYYANDVWPFMFTSGEIGLGWSILCVCVFAAGRWRLGFFLLGLMPIMHVGQMPPVLGLAVLCLLAIALLHPQQLRACFTGLCAGLAITLLFAVVYLCLRVPVPVEGGYAAPGVDPAEVWRRFTYYEDIHRRPTAPPRFGAFANSGMALVAGLMLSAAWLRVALVRGRHALPAAILFAYCVICAAAVWGAWLVQQVMGMDTPYIVIGWLPYRLTNHVAVLLIVLVPALEFVERRGRGFPLAVLTAMAWLGLRPLFALCLPEAVYVRYVSLSEAPLFLLMGAAVLRMAQELGCSPRFRKLWMVAALIGFLALASFQQFLAACFLLGVLLEFTASRFPLRGVFPVGVAYALGLLAIAGMLHTEYRDRKPLESSPFEREMRTWFAAHGDPKGVLLTPFWTLNYQEKTGQPVFATFETPLLIPYMPQLGPTIEKMVTDAYGVRFGAPWSWKLDLWMSRSTEEWQRLAETYGIRYVLSTPDYPLALPELMRGENRVLYEISENR